MRRVTQLIHTLCLLLLLYPAGAAAQSVIQGKVIDKESHLPIDVATVQLTRGKASIPVNYSLSDHEGHFTIKIPKLTDSLFITVSLLGYQPQQQAVLPGQPLSFELEPQVFSLKEVEIRPGRVWGRQDTINYDVTQFLSPKDQSIKDVLRKLPGIDIDDLGKVSYNGKEISKFYIEGLDLTNGRYKQITDNLQADAVQNVQVMENHQPIRILQKKIKTEDIALNLKLKPTFRDRWLVSLEGGLGTSPLLWEAAADALQISRGSQSAYLYKGNNTGQDVSGEQSPLTGTSGVDLSEPEVPVFLEQTAFAAPLKKERWLFNQIHSLSANRLYKLNEDTEFRVNAGYIHDFQTQERGSETSYYQANDTVRIVEQSDSQIRSDLVNLQIGIENNARERYLANQFSATGDWESGLSRIIGNTSSTGPTTLPQRIQTPNIAVRNQFRSLWNREDYTLEFQSLLRYHNHSAKLWLDERLYPMNIPDFYTGNSVSFLRKKGSLTQRYTAGINGEISNIGKSIQGYITPDYQWNTYQWTVSLAIPLKWTGYTGIGFSRVSANPSLSAIYKLNYAWRLSAYASYNERYGEMIDLYDQPYRINYRNSILNCGILPVYKQQRYAVYGEYKNTVRELFITLNLSHTREETNRIQEQRIQDGEVRLASLPLSNHGSNWAARSTLSKGFYDWGLKTSLTALLGISNAERMSEGLRMPFQYRFMRYEPKVIWTPNLHWETSYQASIQQGGTTIGTDTRLAPLWNVIQQIQLSYTFTPVEASLSLDHYHNDVSANKSTDVLFADLSIRWKSKRCQITATATNLFDKRTYGYTEYTALESYTSWVHIRPREFIVSCRLTL